AAGEHVVGHLLASGAFTTVVTVGRRPACVPAQYKAEEFRGELQQVVVNMDHLEADAAAAFKDVDSVFCCLGTTRKAAAARWWTWSRKRRGGEACLQCAAVTAPGLPTL
ncbi:NAD(P)-bd_dom domain-containing protein, partial [Haematococcus lacustris]